LGVISVADSTLRLDSSGIFDTVASLQGNYSSEELGIEMVGRGGGISSPLPDQQHQPQPRSVTFAMIEIYC